VPEPVLLEPDWEMPPGVWAFVTTREGGHSAGPWSSFNLAQHVQDDDRAVTANRQQLLAQLQRRTGVSSLALQWVQQVHGIEVLRADACTQASAPVADAVYTNVPGIACGVLTADCLPVLLCSSDGSEIAVAHAGWRGLCHGVLEQTLQQFAAPPSQIRAWLGPAIAQCHFEVGAEVREAFCQQAKPAALSAIEACFQRGAKPGKWMADIYGLARTRLHAAGVTQAAGNPLCTVCHAERFYSYRHQAVTGRFATLIVKAR
jgi:YfiH family protein